MSWKVKGLDMSRGNEGYVSVVVLLMATVFAAIGIAMLNVQDAALRDIYGILKAGQAKFMAESGAQEAEYVVEHLNAAFSGTSQEQVVYGSNGSPIGSYQYTVSQNGNLYTVSAVGYYPNKAGASSSGGASKTITTSFTYGGIPVTPNSDGLIVLDKTASGALSASGNGTVNVTGKIWDNSSSSSAMSLSGNATITTSEVDMNGKYSTSGNAKVNGTVKTGLGPWTDPFAYLAVPSTTGLTVQSSSALHVGSNSSKTLNPGVYIGGISASGNATITMNPGIYYIQSASGGVGLTLSGNASLTAHGVFIYLEGKNSGEVLSLSGNGAVSWTPPTSGTYAGFAYFQSRTSTNGIKITGNGHMNIAGTLYASDANMALSGNGDNIGSLLVCDTLTLSGNGTLNNYASLH